MQDLSSSDADLLLTLHKAVLEAHLHSDVEALLIDEGDDYIVASRGEVSRPNKDERRQRLGPYLQATTFQVYRDEVPPTVKVSQDGTLGWVIVQIYARGEQVTPDGETRPLEFVSAWIELYEKSDGRWWRTGNVSNFRS